MSLGSPRTTTLERRRIGPYRVVQLLGRGGMGEVYEAVHERIGQRAAIKILSDARARDPSGTARFIQEARALAQLTHPGVVRILHCDELEDGAVYLAMEYLDGITLREWLRRRKTLSIPQAAELGRQIAEAMKAVHARDIIHRDLKPENVFLVGDPDGGEALQVKVLDFGIARVPPGDTGDSIDTRLETRPATWMGTATYMAPEQCRGASIITDRADVYALGVVLHELLAGAPPFAATSDIEVAALHLHAAAPSLLTAVPDTPPALAALVTSMLGKEPPERPSMAAIAEGLSGSWASVSSECPFPGLRPFNALDIELFFGREEVIHATAAELGGTQHGYRRWLQLEGPSGVGKSSLIHAGIIPLLGAPVPGAPCWRVISFRPGWAPLLNLAQALSAGLSDKVDAFDLGALERSFHDDPNALRNLARARTSPGDRLLIVIDQLEELFTLAPEERARIDAQLAGALEDRDGPLHLLSALRSDFAHRLDQLPHLHRLLGEASRRILDPLDRGGLRLVISEMARHAGLRFESGLPDRIVEDAMNTRSPQPLIGHAMKALWYEREGALLSHAGYDRINGVHGALARHAETLLDTLGAPGKARARRILVSLVQVGRGTPDLRRPRTREEVIAIAGGDAGAERVLAQLSGGRDPDAPRDLGHPLRLIAVTGGPELPPSQQRVELVHDTLLGQVPTLARWIDEERPRLERLSDLEAAAHVWDTARRPARDLPTGAILDHYRSAAGERSTASACAGRFLDAASRLERRRRFLRLGFLAAVIAVAAVVVVVAVRAIRSERQTQSHLDRMVKMTDQWVSDVDWDLDEIPHTLAARRTMWGAIEKGLAGLPEAERMQPGACKLLIQTHHGVGALAFTHGTLAAAEKKFDLARGLIDRCRVSQRSHAAEDAAFEQLLGLNLSKLGKVELARGHLDEAERQFGESVAHLRPLLANMDADGRRTLAVSLEELADAMLERGDPAGASRLAGEALGVVAEIPGGDAGMSADALRLRGDAARQAGRREEAGADYRQAQAILDPLFAATPSHVSCRSALSHTLYGLALLDEPARDPDATRAHFGAALRYARELHQEDPSDKPHALVLGRILDAAAAALRGMGDRAAAAPLVEECRKVRDELRRQDPDDVRAQRLACAP